jgi:hypothetical protein
MSEIMDTYEATESIRQEVLSLQDRIGGTSSIAKLVRVRMNVKDCLEELTDSINQKIKYLLLLKEFDVDKVQLLPLDVINLIKDFMIEDIEYVRKVYCIHKYVLRDLYLTNQDISYVGDTIRRRVKETIYHNKKNKLMYIAREVGMNCSSKLNKQELCDNVAIKLIYIMESWDWNNGLINQPIHRCCIDSSYEAYQLIMLLCR